MEKNKTEQGRWEMLGVGKVCLILSRVVKVGLIFFATLLLGICLGIIQKDTHTPVFTEAVFTIAMT